MYYTYNVYVCCTAQANLNSIVSFNIFLSLNVIGLHQRFLNLMEVILHIYLQYPLASDYPSTHTLPSYE